MDSMRNYQFVEEDRDGLAVERPADVVDFRAPEAAVIDSAHGAAATGSIANHVDDAPRSRDPLDAYFRNLDNTELLSREEELALAKRIDEAQSGVADQPLPNSSDRRAGWYLGRRIARGSPSLELFA